VRLPPRTTTPRGSHFASWPKAPSTSRASRCLRVASTPVRRTRSSRCAGCCATSRAGTPTCTGDSSSRRRRRGRFRRVVLAQGRLLDHVRARDDRARRVGRRVGAGGRAGRCEVDVTIDVPSGRMVAHVECRGNSTLRRARSPPTPPRHPAGGRGAWRHRGGARTYRPRRSLRNLGIRNLAWWRVTSLYET
jgi:hypothetical protein